MTDTSNIAPTDTWLRNWVPHNPTGRPLCAWEMTNLSQRLPAFFGELLAFRRADPGLINSDVSGCPEKVDTETLRWWADCYAVNPDYAYTDEDTQTLALIAPEAAKELLAYRLLVTKPKLKASRRLRGNLTRYARFTKKHEAAA
ncbi:MAG: hypothetical protein AAGI09_11990 [Pseudomonadota bacterium]